MKEETRKELREATATMLDVHMLEAGQGAWDKAITEGEAVLVELFVPKATKEFLDTNLQELADILKAPRAGLETAIFMDLIHRGLMYTSQHLKEHPEQVLQAVTTAAQYRKNELPK